MGNKRLHTVLGFKAGALFILLLAMSLLVGCRHKATDMAMVAEGVALRSGYSFEEREDLLTIEIPHTVSMEDGLDLDESVVVALWNNKEFHLHLTELGLSRANVMQAEQLPNPSLGMIFPLGPDAWEMMVRLPMETLVLMPKRIRIARQDHERVATRLIQSGLDIIRDVRMAYAELVLAEKKVGYLETSSRLHQEMEQLFSFRWQAGDISELVAAESHLASLKKREALRLARREARVAHEKFRTLLGLAFYDSDIKVDPSDEVPQAPGDLVVLLQNALLNRPDYRAAEADIGIAGERIGLSRMEILSFAGDMKIEREKDDGRYVTEFKPGFEVVVPIFNQNQAARMRADVGFQRAMRTYAALRDSISYEVKKAHALEQQARQEVNAWQEEILPQLNENLRLARNALEAGAVSPQVVKEKQMALNDGLLQKAKAQANLHMALAELERSVGARLENGQEMVTQVQKP